MHGNLSQGEESYLHWQAAVGPIQAGVCWPGRGKLLPLALAYATAQGHAGRPHAARTQAQATATPQPHFLVQPCHRAIPVISNK